MNCARRSVPAGRGRTRKALSAVPAEAFFRSDVRDPGHTRTRPRLRVDRTRQRERERESARHLYKRHRGSGTAGSLSDMLLEACMLLGMCLLPREDLHCIFVFM